MTRVFAVCCTAFLFVVSALSVNPLYAADVRRPNLIVILADDFGYECLGANGGQSYKTPNLDKLAAGGMRFENCHVQPLCTPTRTQLLTGQYNIRNYVHFANLDPKSTTFANLLQNAGYETGICGKWQLGRIKDLPQKFGFSEALLWQHMRRAGRYDNPGLDLNGEPRDYTKHEYGPDLINDFALDFVTRHKDKPFLLYYPMLLTHGPFEPTPDSADWKLQANGEKIEKGPKYFGDMTVYMDKMVGRLLKKLDDLDLRENTLVIFLGDNGTLGNVTSTINGRQYKGGKGATTENGTHVPLIVNWPGHVSAGQTSTDLVDSTDILPTVCEAAGVKIPEKLITDGHSFLPQALGQSGKPREWIYSWYVVNDDGPQRPSECAMNKTYKLYRDGRFFNLATDRFERRPLKVASLTGADAEAAKLLQVALDQYKDARPVSLRRTYQDNLKAAGSGKGQPGKKAKAKKVDDL